MTTFCQSEWCEGCEASVTEEQKKTCPICSAMLWPTYPEPKWDYDGIPFPEPPEPTDFARIEVGYTPTHHPTAEPEWLAFYAYYK